MKLYLYPYKMGSVSAKDLAKGLGINRIKHVGSKFNPTNKKTVINWGSSSLPDKILSECAVINKPDNVKLCANKLHFFKTCEAFGITNIPKPLYTKEDAQKELDNGATIVARTILTGHSGAGIVLVDLGGELPDCKLYTTYVKKTDEYRVHIFSGQIIDVQRKARRMDVPKEEVNWRVRNHANGFIFARDNVVLPDSVKDAALQFAERFPIDFCALDLVFGTDGGAYILEANTAPGITGTTLEKYVEAFNKYLDNGLAYVAHN